MYLDDFNELYNPPAEFDYKDDELKPKKFNADCVVFCHVLEHMPNFETVKKWITKQDADIVIYGPNIESAKHPGWVHFLTDEFDHNTFFTIDAITEVAEKAGFEVVSMAYSDDMLLWMRK